MRSLLLLSSILLLGSAAAQEGVIDRIDRTVNDTVTGIAGEGRLVVGLGLGIAGQPYAALRDQVRFVPVPLVTYQSERFEFIGKTLDAQLYETHGLAFSAVADWRFQSYDGSDSPVLEGMADRSGTLELGGRVKTTALGVQLSGTGLVDTLSRHGGYQLEGRASVELSNWRPLSVRPNVGARYQSSNLADYYFGVDPEEAFSQTCPVDTGPDCLAFERPAYETGDALVPFIGLTARQVLSTKLIAGAALQYQFLPDQITNSPIVEDSNQVFAFIGLAYAFGAPLGSEGSYEMMRPAR